MSGSQSQGQAGTSRSQSGQTTGGTQSGMFNDKNLCSDMLATEKFVSSAYDTAIFECTNSNIRQILNHIQKEEQQHGEQIFNYMQSHGMYSVQ
jgi:spore coat protein CotF